MSYREYQFEKLSAELERAERERDEARVTTTEANAVLEWVSEVLAGRSVCEFAEDSVPIVRDAIASMHSSDFYKQAAEKAERERDAARAKLAENQERKMHMRRAAARMRESLVDFINAADRVCLDAPPHPQDNKSRVPGGER